MANLVNCFGCGKDISERCSDRYNMQGPSCSRAIPIWKRKLEQVLTSRGIKIDIDCLIEEGNGRMCRSCVSALIRLEKSVELNLVDAVEVIVQHPRKRICTESSQSSCGSKTFAPLSFASSGVDQETKSPDVAVSILLFLHGIIALFTFKQFFNNNYKMPTYGTATYDLLLIYNNVS